MCSIPCATCATRYLISFPIINVGYPIHYFRIQDPHSAIQECLFEHSLLSVLLSLLCCVVNLFPILDAMKIQTPLVSPLLSSLRYIDPFRGSVEFIIVAAIESRPPKECTIRINIIRCLQNIVIKCRKGNEPPAYPTAT